MLRLWCRYPDAGSLSKIRCHLVIFWSALGQIWWASSEVFKRRLGPLVEAAGLPGHAPRRPVQPWDMYRRTEDPGLTGSGGCREGIGAATSPARRVEKVKWWWEGRPRQPAPGTFCFTFRAQRSSPRTRLVSSRVRCCSSSRLRADCLMSRRIFSCSSL